MKTYSVLVNGKIFIINEEAEVREQLKTGNLKNCNLLQNTKTLQNA